MSQTWIFQANPKSWDIDRYLEDVERADTSADLMWLVTSHAHDIAVGDLVFLWRSGKSAGVVATAIVTGDVGEYECLEAVVGLVVRLAGPRDPALPAGDEFRRRAVGSARVEVNDRSRWKAPMSLYQDPDKPRDRPSLIEDLFRLPTKPGLHPLENQSTTTLAWLIDRSPEFARAFVELFLGRGAVPEGTIGARTWGDASQP